MRTPRSYRSRFSLFNLMFYGIVALVALLLVANIVIYMMGGQHVCRTPSGRILRGYAMLSDTNGVGQKWTVWSSTGIVEGFGPIECEREWSK